MYYLVEQEKTWNSSLPRLVFFGGKQTVLSAPGDERIPHDGGGATTTSQVWLPLSKGTPAVHVLLLRRAKNTLGSSFFAKIQDNRPASSPSHTYLVKPALPLSPTVPGLLAVNAVSFACPLVFHRRKFSAVIASTSAFGTSSHGLSRALPLPPPVSTRLSVCLTPKELLLQREPWSEGACMYEASLGLAVP